MDYEKKLALAKEALDSGSYDKETIEYIFPELRESEDERIRKAIKKALQVRCDGSRIISDEPVTLEEAIAWLEKQGKNNMGISEATKQKLEDNLNKALEKETPESWNKFLDEQGEQKLIESMPEFKEGDILYNKDSYASDSIFIFKGMSDKTNAYLCYARLYDKKDFSVYSKEDWDEGVGIYGGEFYPANHKQKELLFSEIEKAGYKWNPDKKKMEKIEQKPAWSEDDQSNFNELSSFIFETYRTEDASRLITWLEYLKDRVQPMQEWSEEDRLHYMNVLEALEYVKGCKSDYDKIEAVKSDIAWFKFLKDRYIWKPNESDIRILEQVIDGTVNPINYHAILYAILEQLKKLREE